MIAGTQKDTIGSFSGGLRTASVPPPNLIGGSADQSGFARVRLFCSHSELVISRLLLRMAAARSSPFPVPWAEGERRQVRPRRLLSTCANKKTDALTCVCTAKVPLFHSFLPTPDERALVQHTLPASITLDENPCKPKLPRIQHVAA